MTPSVTPLGETGFAPCEYVLEGQLEDTISIEAFGGETLWKAKPLLDVCSLV